MQTAATLISDQQDEKPSTSLFDQIYEIAKEAKNDKENAIRKLLHILKHDGCVDVRGSGGMLTPAGKLAKEGDKDAVEFLMKFGASVNFIAWGAAFGGRRDYAEHLRSCYGASVHRIAEGASAGGDWDYVAHLRLQCTDIDVNFIATGAAYGGHRLYVEDLRLTYHASLNVDKIAYCAAAGGHRDYPEYLRLNCGASVHWIADGAASSGFQDYAEYLRLNHGAGVNTIARSAASGGHRGYAEYLRLNHNANVNCIAEGAGYGGYRNYSEYLRVNHGADVNCIARRAAQGGHLNYLECLHLNNGANLSIIVIGASCTRLFRNSKIALRSFCFMKNHDYRIQFAKELKKEALAALDVSPLTYDITKVARKAKKIVELRPRYNFDQCIALGNHEIQTWFLQGAVLMKQGKIADHLFLSIATYLSPLTFNEARGLYKKSRFDMFQKLLVKGVNRYCAQTRDFYFFNRDKKAEEFSKACAEAKDNKKMVQLLTNESERISQDEKSQQNKKENPYKDLIARHLKRFG